jgi:hypothetical protein
MPPWIATILSIFTSSALKLMFDIITTRKSALVFGVVCLVIGALCGSVPLILIGAGAIVWVTYAESRDDKQGN